MKSDTAQAYGSISRLLHWLMAAGFAFMLFTAAAWNYNEDYYSLMDWHKSVGFVLLLLVVVRLVWALANARCRPGSTLLAKLGHWALYVLMVAVPLLGMLRQYGSARGEFKVFGIPLMAGAPEKVDWMVQLGNQWHGSLAWTLFVLAAGHIAMAVIHQIKGEKIINRMAGR